MEMKFRIIEAYPNEHQIVVRFYTDELPESELISQAGPNGEILRARTDVAILLPVPPPNGDALVALIMRHCPTHFFELKKAISDPLVDTSLGTILPLVGQEVTHTVVTNIVNTPTRLSNAYEMKPKHHAVERL
jgi:hypothetical protein